MVMLRASVGWNLEIFLEVSAVGFLEHSEIIWVRWGPFLVYCGVGAG